VPQKEWIMLAMFGVPPCSRWSNMLASHNDNLYIFGGVNLNSYCKSNLYKLQIINFGVSKGKENEGSQINKQ
jgi:hypothetical protein